MNQFRQVQVLYGTGLIGVVALIGYSILNFLAAGRDDTFIMLWAGQALGTGPWFVNYNNATQEVASSIIGVLIAALTKGQSVGHALLIVKLFGLFSACATLYLIWWKRTEIFPGSMGANWFALATVIATAASPVFMYWSLGGLETPHHALLLLSYSLVLLRSITINRQSGLVDWWLLGVGFLLVLVRTEAFWPVFFAGFWLVLARRVLPVPIQALRAIFLTLVLFLLLLGLRYAFTGVLWTNPVYAKVGDYAVAIPAGLRYVSNYFVSSPWAWVQGLAVVYGASKFLKFSLLAMRRRASSSSGLLVEAVLGGLVLFHLLFVVVTGGNWMEYFRFMAAIVPLMNLLVFLMLANLAFKRVSGPILIGTSVLLGFLSLTQSSYSNEAWNCSKPTAMAGNLFSLEGLSEAVIRNNCEILRDSNGIKPFIENKLPELLKKNNGKLTFASYQGGFFPYHLRQDYSPEEIYFLDSFGLTELEVARLPGEKSTFGVRVGKRIDLILQGKAGALSEYFAKRPVNLVYLLGATPEERYNYEDLGYETVWDVDGAVVFYRGSALEKANPSRDIMPFVSDVRLGDRFGIFEPQGRATLFVHPGATTATSFNFAAAGYLRASEGPVVNIHARIAPNIPEEAVKRGGGNVRVRILQGEKQVVDGIVSVGDPIQWNLPISGDQPLQFIVDNNGGADTDWLLLSIH